MQINEHIQKMLLLGQKLVTSSPLLDSEVGTVNVKGDKTIAMDKKMEEILLTYLSQQKVPCHVYSEEIGLVKLHANPEYLFAFDPLDGSANYKFGKNLLPYGLLIACFRGTNPLLGDVIASGMIEFTTKISFIFNGDRVFKTSQSQKTVTMNKVWAINNSTPVNLDLYYKQAYERFRLLPERVHVRWSGSTTGSLLYTLSEVSAAMGSVQMRPEEIGTVVSLIKGGGGTVVDLHGESLLHKPFSIDKTYEIIAGNQEVVDFILNKLERSN